MACIVIIVSSVCIVIASWYSIQSSKYMIELIMYNYGSSSSVKICREL